MIDLGELDWQIEFYQHHNNMEVVEELLEKRRNLIDTQPCWMPEYKDWSELEKRVLMPDRIEPLTPDQRIEQLRVNAAPNWEIEYWEERQDHQRPTQRPQLPPASLK